MTEPPFQRFRKGQHEKGRDRHGRALVSSSASRDAYSQYGRAS